MMKKRNAQKNANKQSDGGKKHGIFNFKNTVVPSQRAWVFGYGLSATASQMAYDSMDTLAFA